jgi:hypothetical protein
MSACADFVRFDSRKKRPMDPDIDVYSVDELAEQTIHDHAGADGWVALSTFGQEIKIECGLTARDTGSRTWSAYLSSHPRFECTRGEGSATWVRVSREC